MPPDTGNIRVFVRWHEQVVFAGEEVRCTITFKNVDRGPGSSSGSALSTPTAALHPPAHFPETSARHPSPRQPSPLHPGVPGRAKPGSSLAPPPAARGHRSSLSLSVPSAAARARGGSVSWSLSPSPAAAARAPRSGNGNGNGNGNGSGSGSGNGTRPGHGHKRSVSIVSIGSLNTVDDAQGNASSTRPQRPARGHVRASSLQILPRGGLSNGPRSGEFLVVRWAGGILC